MDEKFEQTIREIRKKDPRYALNAYDFVNLAVNFTVNKLARGNKPRGSRHVSGQELTVGVMDYSISQFGFLAPEVLDNWGIRSGDDIGNIVYNMIGAELLSAGPEDSRSDFNCFPNLIDDLKTRVDSCLQLPDPPSPPVLN